MKYLCLAYGAEEDWKLLSKPEQAVLLAQDEALRRRGVRMGAVEPNALTVRAWDEKPLVNQGPFASADVPLAGFSIIEASDIHEVIEMVAKDPVGPGDGRDRNTADHCNE